MAHDKLKTFHLFSGAGGGILADLLLGHIPVGACELEEYPRNVLLQRQRDGILPEFPIWDDIRTLDGKPWRGLVDVVAGGFPCQGISSAGKGEGLDDPRSGLWKEMARFIGEVQPRFVFVENSPVLTSRGLGIVLGDLAEMGYDAKWGVLGAEDAIWSFGSPEVYHERMRIWIIAESTDAPWIQQGREEQRTQRKRTWAMGQRETGGEGSNADQQHDDASRHGAGEVFRRRSPEAELSGGEKTPDTLCFGRGQVESKNSGGESREGVANQTRQRSVNQGISNWWLIEPDVGRVAHGVASRVDRLKAIGNGQVPAVAAAAWRILSE